MTGYHLVGTLKNPKIERVGSAAWNASIEAYANNTPEYPTAWENNTSGLRIIKLYNLQYGIIRTAAKTE
jgi:hypothetical protein